MVDQAGKAIAKADGACFESNAPRYRKLALGALKPLARPTEAMVDAGHAEAWLMRSGRSIVGPTSRSRCAR